MINAAHASAQFRRRAQTEGRGSPAMRGDFVERTQEHVFRATDLQAMRDGTAFAIEMTAAIFAVGGK